MASNRTQYFSGNGDVYFAEKNELGRPEGGLIFLGNCKSLELSPSVETEEHNETSSGLGAVDEVFERNPKIEISGSFCNFTQENLDLYMYGKSLTVPAATVTGEVQKAYLGRNILLDRPIDGNLTITDVGGATTYTSGQDYLQRKTNIIYLPNTGSTIANGQEVELNYDSPEYRNNTAFTVLNTNKYLVFDGLNRTGTKQKVRVEVYKCRFNPASALPFINDSFAEYEISGMGLFDNCFESDEQFGAFMRVINI